jgi:hypothetical protein
MKRRTRDARNIAMRDVPAVPVVHRLPVVIPGPAPANPESRAMISGFPDAWK